MLLLAYTLSSTTCKGTVVLAVLIDADLHGFFLSGAVDDGLGCWLGVGGLGRKLDAHG